MLKRLNIEDFDKVYEIMLDSFPEDERRGCEKQRALLERDDFKIFTLNDDASGDIKAFISVYDFEELLFIEHFAVAREHRGLGLGSTVLKELLQNTKKQACLEVELPDTDIAKRRISFYKRNGFFLNDFPYIQPSIDDGRAPVPLRIMTTQNLLSSSEFEKIRSILYINVYNKLD